MSDSVGEVSNIVRAPMRGQSVIWPRRFRAALLLPKYLNGRSFASLAGLPQATHRPCVGARPGSDQLDARYFGGAAISHLCHSSLLARRALFEGLVDLFSIVD